MWSADGWIKKTFLNWNLASMMQLKVTEFWLLVSTSAR